jgi:hypothetical protein
MFGVVGRLASELFPGTIGREANSAARGEGQAAAEKAE